VDTFTTIVLVGGILIGAGSIIGLAVAAFIAFTWE
jgi:hypothetical protein